MNKMRRALIISMMIAFGFTSRGFAFTSVAKTTTSCEVAFVAKSVPLDPISLEADFLLKCQVKDLTYGADDLGCFNDVVLGSGPTWVVPRENGTAMLGLIEAYMAAGNEDYKTAVLRCADYLKRRQETDGFWCSNYDEKFDVRIDSSPSVSQTGSVVMAFFKVMKMDWEDGSHQYYETAKKAGTYLIAAIDNKPGSLRGLSGSGKEYGAGPDFPLEDTFGHYRWGGWSWISDNCYVYQALMDMKEWAMIKGDNEFAALCYDHAIGVLNGVNSVMKNPSNAVWYRVVDQDGSPVDESTRIDAMCYYPQKMDLPVTQYGSANIAQWMTDNLQVTTGVVPDGKGAFIWGDADPDPTPGKPNRALRYDRRSQGFSMEAWLALNDIADVSAESYRSMAKNWWESQNNTGGHVTNGRLQLWDIANGGITDWYDPDGMPDGYVASDWQRFIDTSAYAIFVYSGGYNFRQANEDPIASASIGAGGGTLSLREPNGTANEMELTIPQGALDATQQISVKRLDINSVPQAKSGGAVAVYEFLPSGLTFKRPATLKIAFIDTNKDGIIDGTQDRASDLKIMLLDGSEWRLLGGNVDIANSCVTWEINHFSIYALFHVGAISDDDYRTKDRIITPLTAGYDKARFSMLSAGDRLNIYDVTGRRVRQISQTPFDWDGRDEDNDVVESGIYVYQIKAAGRTVSGTIVVAK